MPTSAHTDVLKLSAEMLRFTSGIGRLATPDVILDGLHNATHHATPLNVLGVALFPLRWGDWSGFEKGKTVFLHKSAPEGWWDEDIELTRKHPGPGYRVRTTVSRAIHDVGIDADA